MRIGSKHFVMETTGVVNKRNLILSPDSLRMKLFAHACEKELVNLLAGKIYLASFDTDTKKSPIMRTFTTLQAIFDIDF